MGCKCSISNVSNVSTIPESFFDILLEYIKIPKKKSNLTDKEAVQLQSWKLILGLNKIPEGFFSKEEEEKITKDQVAVYVEPIWKMKRDIIIFYREENNTIGVTHIQLSHELLKNPKESKDIPNMDEKTKEIIVKSTWFLLIK